jgi:hypothetical protein
MPRLCLPCSLSTAANATTGTLDHAVPCLERSWLEERLARRCRRSHLQVVDAEPVWSDSTVILDLLMDVHAGVFRLLDYFDEDDGEEENPEEDS